MTEPSYMIIFNFLFSIFYRKRSYEESSNSATSGNYPPAKRFDYNRLGGGRGRGGRGGAHGGRHGGASKVLVKNIPTGLNTIAHINNHFARFGTLVNVQVRYSTFLVRTFTESLAKLADYLLILDLLLKIKID